MPKKSAAEVRRLTDEAYLLDLKGWSYTAIGEHLAVTRQYVAKLIEGEREKRADEALDFDAVAAIDRYRKTIADAEAVLGTISPQSTNLTGLHNVILKAQERIDKITGVESPLKIQDVGEVEVEWNDTRPGEIDDDDLDAIRNLEPDDFAS